MRIGCNDFSKYDPIEGRTVRFTSDFDHSIIKIIQILLNVAPKIRPTICSKVHRSLYSGRDLSRVTPTLRPTSRYEFCVKNSWFAQNPNNLTDKTPRSAPTRLSRRRQKQKRLTEKGPQQLLALETQFLIETLVCGKTAGTQQAGLL